MRGKIEMDGWNLKVGAGILDWRRERIARSLQTDHSKTGEDLQQ